MANIASDEVLVDGKGSVNGEQFVDSRAPAASKDGSEQTQFGLSHPLIFTHWPKKGSSSHSQLPQPPDDELEELEGGVELDEELDGCELEELELVIMTPQST